MNARLMAVAGLAAILMAAGGTMAAVNIETVHVGDANNVADTAAHSGNANGQGSVAYEYNIGKYEVTAGQYCVFLNAVAMTDTYSLYNPTMSRTDWGSGIARSGGGTVGNPYTYSVATDFANRPVNHVRFWDSCRFANWLQNGQPTGPQGAATTERGTYTLDGYTGMDGRTIQRILSTTGSTWAVTSEDEWYKAAYYKGGSTSAGYWLYPTRSDSAPGRDMADPLPGNNANYYNGSGPYPIDNGYYTTLVGEFQNSPSPYGTFDQGGNVFEWNEAIPYQDQTYASRGLRGGSFNFNDDFLQSSNRINGDPTIEFQYIGFRVSEVPEPATLSLLSLGGLVLARRRLRA